MSAAATFTIRTAAWPGDADTLRAIRREVFVEEQGVAEAIEWDGRDGECVHAIALADVDGAPIGCGRLLPDGHVGRMAVRAPWRGRGVGGALLAHLVVLARAAGHAKVALNAQTHACEFYARYGFVPAGEVFMEAGIPHQEMIRSL